jgi:integrase
MGAYKENGVWHIHFRFKDITGKTHRIHRSSKKWKLKKDALAAEEHLKLQLTREYDDLTYSQLFHLYIEERTGKIKNRSIYDITKVSDKHIKPFFDKMSYVTPKEIKKWQQHLLTLDYSNKQLSKIQQLFKTVINFGLKYEYINYNPFKTQIAKNNLEFKKEMLFWEQDEWEQFIQVVDNETYHALFSLLYWSGLRLGEALALQDDDIDFKTGTISVSKTYNHVQHEITTPKTSNSYRTVRLTDNVLNEMYIIYTKHKTAFRGGSIAFIFGFDTPLHPNTVRRYFNHYISKAEVKKIRIHDLRHSHVSLLRHLGFDRYEVAKRLGHTPEMVDNTYTHWFEKSQQNMIDKLNVLEKSKDFVTNLSLENNKH